MGERQVIEIRTAVLTDRLAAVEATNRATGQRVVCDKVLLRFDFEWDTPPRPRMSAFQVGFPALANAHRMAG